MDELIFLIPETSVSMIKKIKNIESLALRKPIIYLAGPMSGKPDKNRAEFDKYDKLFSSYGFDVINVCKVEQDEELLLTWEEYLKRDLAYLSKCDCVVLLDGWKYSRGATLEHFIATQTGIEFRNKKY